MFIRRELVERIQIFIIIITFAANKIWNEVKFTALKARRNRQEDFRDFTIKR
ncbi:hypothetical protein MARINOS108_120544 [Marinoscillum sp. 108]|nr:hypothetical protein MARINOS108_120544 [Marinoscillum sp. 108]